MPSVRRPLVLLLVLAWSAGLLVATGPTAGAAGAPRLSARSVTTTEPDSGRRAVVVPLRLSRSAPRAVTLAFRTRDGSARAGSDYVAAHGRVRIPAGHRTARIRLFVLGDRTYEGVEKFAVQLSQGRGVRLPRRPVTVTINDNDAAPSLSIGDPSTVEGDSGTTALSFPVTLSAASGLPASVDYAVTGGSATAGTDYVALPAGTLSIPAGETSGSIVVQVIGDTAVEPDETVELTLSNPQGAVPIDSSATGTIRDDDRPGVSIGDQRVLEGGTAVLPLTLSTASSRPVSVSYATAPGTAGAGDFTATSGTVTFAPGQTSRTVSVATTADTLDEADETFTVQLSSPVDTTIARGTATVTITDDDGPVISVSGASQPEGWTTHGMGFTVSLSAPSPQEVSVHYTTAVPATNPATPNNDYLPVSGDLVFPAGATSRTISVSVIGDLVAESNEYFSVVLSNPVNATANSVPGVGVIQNDDCSDFDEGLTGATDLGQVDADVYNAATTKDLTSTICLNDSDWYKITLHETYYDTLPLQHNDLYLTAVLTPNANPTQTTGHLKLQVYSASGTLLSTAAATPTGFKTVGKHIDFYTVVPVPIDPNDDVAVYVRVSPDGANQVNQYRLTLTGGPPGAAVDYTIP